MAPPLMAADPPHRASQAKAKPARLARRNRAEAANSLEVLADPESHRPHDVATERKARAPRLGARARASAAEGAADEAGLDSEADLAAQDAEAEAAMEAETLEEGMGRDSVRDYFGFGDFGSDEPTNATAAADAADAPTPRPSVPKIAFASGTTSVLGLEHVEETLAATMERSLQDEHLELQVRD